MSKVASNLLYAQSGNFLIQKYLCYGVALLLALATPTQAQVYTWTDANGVAHYSDSPSQENAKIVNLAPPVPLTSHMGTSTPAPTESSSSNLPAPPTPQQRQAAIEQQEKLEKFCTDLKYNLSMLVETGRRVYQVLPNGETHYFNDNERQQQIDKTKQELDLYCNPNNPPPTTNTP
jgi:hypothetical protein